MTHDSAPHRNLESLKKEAKRWLAALQSGDPEAQQSLGAPDHVRRQLGVLGQGRSTDW